MPMIEHFLMESPLGTLTLVNTNGVLSGLYMPEHLRGPRVDSLGSRATSGFDVVRSQLDEYFERKRIHFYLPIALHGTIFQQSVWNLLQTIPYGETRSMENSRTCWATAWPSVPLGLRTAGTRSALLSRATELSAATEASRAMPVVSNESVGCWN
jgi:hypothetical protein